MGGRLGVLLGAFKAGMSSFAAGGYRVATAAAQVGAAACGGRDGWGGEGREGREGRVEGRGEGGLRGVAPLLAALQLARHGRGGAERGCFPPCTYAHTYRTHSLFLCIPCAF